MHMWRPSWFRPTLERIQAWMHSWRSIAVSAVVDEIAFDWALWQALVRPTHALADQILEFGGAIASNLSGQWRPSITERWDLIFRAILQAQTYAERRYSDRELEKAITLVKSSLSCSNNRR